MKNNIPQYSNKRLLRVSAVVLDAYSGDLLASALYPLPNKDSLVVHESEKSYKDGNFGKKQRAWTDRDLGLAFFTAPGSTAKVMTALAGLQKEGRSAAKKSFFIHSEERVEMGIEPIGNVTMEDAIVKSSNCYFINLMNYFNLYSALDSIYAATGARLEFVTPYYFRYTPMIEERQEKWKSIVSSHQSEGLARYQSYIASKKPSKMNFGAWQWAWGQGTLSATPLGMARVVSTVANGGVMPKTRFRLDDPQQEGIRLVSNESASILKGYMHTMALKANGSAANAITLDYVGGKTGTPQRTLKGKRKPNDGWFIFYVDGCTVSTGNKKENHPLAVAVRIERLADSGMGSGVAMRMSRDMIIPILQELGYHAK